MARLSDEGGPITVRVFVLYIVIPYLIGVYYSKHNLPYVRSKLHQLAELTESFLVSQQPVKYNSQVSAETCLQRLLVIMHNGQHVKRHDQPFANLTVVMHHNGKAEPCGRTNVDIIQGLENLLNNEPGRCPISFEKYQIEALLTRLFHSLLLSEQGGAGGGSCQPQDRLGTGNAHTTMSLYDYCDLGVDRTPILPDHDELVSIDHGNGNDDAGDTSLPCHFHSLHGIRVTSLPLFAQLARNVRAPVANQKDGDTCDETTDEGTTMECTVPQDKEFTRELHLYAVPAGRVFMFAASHVGEIISLPHIQGADPKQPVYLRVLSTTPRVFDVFNFFDRRDSDDLIEGALRETREAYRIKRSSVGVAGSSINKRTSESGFDTSGPVALKLKRRGISLLGFDEYKESFTDGLQILRYNETTAYNSHLDWMEPADSGEYDFQSMGVGGNRFATILLYLSDLGEDEGGETVFPKALPASPTNETEAEVGLAKIQRLFPVEPSHVPIFLTAADH